MFSMFNLSIDSILFSFAAFIFVLALIAVYQMHDIRKGLLFIGYITASIFLIYLFITYSFISSILVLLYIGHLLYNNLKEPHQIEE